MWPSAVEVAVSGYADFGEPAVVVLLLPVRCPDETRFFMQVLDVGSAYGMTVMRPAHKMS
jgi:hypothetical protein